jgi:hypothetical protein
VAHAGDAVVQQPPARLEDREEVGHVRVDVAAPDVLDHADARDRVELVRGQVAVVAHLELDLAVEPRVLRLLPRQLRLRRRERDAEHPRAVLLRGVARERAPAGADVEDVVTRLQRQLATHHVELLELRLLQRRRAAVPDRARVRHGVVEEVLEEVVGDVVVVADGALVARDAVPAPGRAQLGGRHRRRRLDARGTHRGQGEPRLRLAIDGGRLPGADDVQRGVHVAGDDLAGDVRAAHAELPGRAERVGDGAG